MFIVLAVLWFIIGYGIMVYTLAKIADEITVGDLFVCILGGIAGPSTLILLLIYLIDFKLNKVIWKRKK